MQSRDTMQRGFPTRLQMKDTRDELLQMDWITRHEALSVWRERDHLAYCRLLTMLGPGQARTGIDEGRSSSYMCAVIVAFPPVRPKRQLTLEEAFLRQVAPRRE